MDPEPSERPRTAPSQRALDRLWDGVRRVRVLDGGMSGGEPLGGDVLLDLIDPPELEALHARLAIDDGGAGSCRCHGDPALELCGTDDRRLAVLGVHHGVSIRWDAWNADARLVDGAALLSWLDERGVSEPLRRFWEAGERRRQAAALEVHWRAAVPEPIGHLADDFVQASRTGRGTDELARQAEEMLEQAMPDDAERARALLRWFGAGSGRGSGYPVHEGIPEVLLLRLETSVLVEALDDGDEPLMQGALRYFTGSQFNRTRSGDAERIPPDLAAHLLALAERSNDADKQARARRAFGRR